MSYEELVLEIFDFMRKHNIEESEEVKKQYFRYRDMLLEYSDEDRRAFDHKYGWGGLEPFVMTCLSVDEPDDY